MTTPPPLCRAVCVLPPPPVAEPPPAAPCLAAAEAFAAAGGEDDPALWSAVLGQQGFRDCLHDPSTMIKAVGCACLANVPAAVFATLPVKRTRTGPLQAPSSPFKPLKGP